MLDISQILRWLVTAIVLVVAILLSIALLHIATVLLGYAVRALIMLLLVASALRLFEYLRSR
jgi:hypothetical protein